MENEIKKRKLDNERKIKKILLCLIFNMFFQFGISYVGINNVVLMLEAMLVFINVSEFKRDLLINLSSLLAVCLPMVVNIVCNINLFKLNKQRCEIREKEVEYLSKKAFEENKYKIDELLEEGKTLSRAGLINWLNATKAELLKAEEKNKFKCKTGDILLYDYLRDGLEDILFPSVDEKENGYTKVRKK